MPFAEIIESLKFLARPFEKFNKRFLVQLRVALESGMGPGTGIKRKIDYSKIAGSQLLREHHATDFAPASLAERCPESLSDIRCDFDPHLHPARSAKP